MAPEEPYTCAACPADGWGCCGTWNDGIDRRPIVAARHRPRVTEGDRSSDFSGRDASESAGPPHGRTNRRVAVVTHSCGICHEDNAWPEIGQACRRCHARTASHLRQLPRLVEDLVSLGYVERDLRPLRCSTPRCFERGEPVDVIGTVRIPGHARRPRTPLCADCAVRLFHDGHLPEYEAIPARPADPVAHGATAGPLNAPKAGARVSGTALPAAPANLDAVDLSGPSRQGSRALHARGVLGLDEDQIGHLSVATVLDTWVRDWASYRTEGLPDPQVPLLTCWLLDRWDWACEVHPAIDEFAEEIRELYVTLSAVTGQLPARPEARDRACPKCGLLTLTRDPDSGYTECGNVECRTMLTESEYREHLQRLIDMNRRSTMKQPPAGTVRVFLTVWRTQDFGTYRPGVDRGWFRDVRLRFLPERGDSVELWADGPTWPVDTRTWSADGAVTIELLGMQVDPDDGVREAMRRVPDRRQAWWTVTDGDPDAALAEGGWARVGGEAA